MAALTTIYKCADGTDFPVEWESPDDPNETWWWNEGHWPLPMKPLDAAAWKISLAGRDRAFADAELPIAGAGGFRGFVCPNGFAYMLATSLTEREQADVSNAANQLIERCGGEDEVWHEFCLPRIQKTCKLLQMSDASVPVRELVEMQGYAFFLTFVASTVIRAGRDTLVRFLKAEFGSQADDLSIELTLGHRNATLDADQALWELAQEVRNRPALRDAVVESGSAEILNVLAHLDESVDVLPLFDEYLQQYGWRAEGWESSLPTWRERPDIPLGFMRDLVVNEVRSPLDALAQVAQKRESLVEEVEDRLKPDNAKVARFRKLLEANSSYVAVREGRAQWQLNASGSLRTPLLRKGQQLAAAGVIAEPDDMFFLLPDEVDANLTQGSNSLKSLVEQRRREWEMWRTKRPPLEIGSTDQTTEIAQSTQGEKVIRGIGSSKGKVTATAKVLRDLSEAHKLESGDVLVCVMTSPPWTILFTKASAVVTDTGSALSHAAIAAREYGIPCVTAARSATQQIQDGMVVTVDGGEGTVRIEG